MLNAFIQREVLIDNGSVFSIILYRVPSNSSLDFVKDRIMLQDEG